jgi:hypothetical protein
MACAVRIPIDPDARLPLRRTLDDRFYLRWPSIYASIARAVQSLPPRSRLRRALLRRTMLSGWAPFARWDLDLTLPRYAPGFELEPLREFLTFGVRSSYKGRSGLREWVTDMRDAWERMEVRPLEIVDAGNPIVSSATLTCALAEAASSSTTNFGAVFWSEQGLIVRELHFSDWDEALRAAGINADPRVAGTKAGIA